MERSHCGRLRTIVGVAVSICSPTSMTTSGMAATLATHAGAFSAPPLEPIRAEVGGWHDWLWFHVDELSGSFDEMKVSGNKDGSFYLTDEQRYVPTGKFEIRHYNWAYLASSGVFIPTRYEMSVDTDAGVLEIGANVVSAYAASGIRDVPDSPTIILDWDRLEGTFTYLDGRIRTLTSGLGGTLIRQWRPYPSSQLTPAFLKADGAPRI